MAKIYDFTIKNITTWIGRDGIGCQGNIYYRGKKVGWYNDSADGGTVDVDFFGEYEARVQMKKILDDAAEKYFHTYPLEGIFAELPPTGDLFLSELITLIILEKEYKKGVKQGKPYMWFLENTKTLNQYTISAENEEYIERVLKKSTVRCIKKYTSMDDFIIKE